MNFNFLSSGEYSFLDKAPLKDNLMLLTIGGSHAYGMNVDTPEHKSDIDLRGIMFNTADEILLGKESSVFTDEVTDTTIYSFGKVVKLLLNCNPNVIEILGCREEDYHYIHPLGQLLLDNKHEFVTRRCIKSFGGYAYQQLSRLENALARDRVSQTKQEEHILNSVKSAMLTMNDRYKDFGEGFCLYVGDSDKTEFDTEIFLDINLRKYPLRDFNGVIQEFTAIQKQYSKIGHRNRKKDDVHLNKHAAHLVRLYLMFIDLLRKGEIVTYREKDHDLLMNIRNGYYMEEDGSYKQEFFDMIEELKATADYEAKTTMLPEKPDMDKINRIVTDVNMYVIENKRK